MSDTVVCPKCQRTALEALSYLDQLTAAASERDRLRTLLRELAEEVISSVSSCDGVVSMGAESLARIVIEEELAK